MEDHKELRNSAFKAAGLEFHCNYRVKLALHSMH